MSSFIVPSTESPASTCCVPSAVAAPSVHAELASENDALVNDVENLSLTLADKFEEIRLIHDLAASLELDDQPADICEELLEQLSVCVRCQSLIIQLDPDEDELLGGGLQGTGTTVELPELDAIVAAAKSHWAKLPELQGDAVIVNHGSDAALKNRRVVLMPIERGNTQLGQLIAIRTHEDDEFGTVEVDLFRSVLVILAMHLMNQRHFAEMQSMLEGTVRSLASALDAKDAYTHGHSSRVADLAVELSRRLGMGQQTADALQLAGILHDIGKIGVDDSVLKKPGQLTDEEFEQIKEHPVIGYEILKDIRPFRHILPAVRHHHESWDGRGYPDGLAGEQIPRDAQILAVADAFDAMVSDRPYRKGMPLSKVREIFQNGRDQQWAADIVDVLLESDDLLEAFTAEHQSARLP